ncbi:DNA mismatch repair endonuclease MutL [Hoylesella nanceiensis]|jgi:DNA mismatch repair protein mutL|uniref:DNA mismatch repair endonuclease MutL n=1 Tax=Hoylesella nanceiensis TaxID=425941 RepID=UPI0028E323E6|nr:DNA mismatch repair endonuclease MutL [Hoylesella nanceiensis]
MQDVIQLLPDTVANQIAAGEVIQRPASVIKELVENSIDAEATTINVLVVDAGRTSIQVIDDGKGMSDTDARLSFERHATSKIRSADDLFKLHTMGFRGEALASIAAVAQVQLKTRQKHEDLGTVIHVAGSKYISQEPCTCAVGTNFLIENLFYNVPARRKFLKSNTTELNNIITAFQRIALVYPHITFTLHSNGNELINLRAGTLRQRIVDIFGKRINQDLLSLETETTFCKIYGFVGKPESAKKKGAQQYFFVNGRYMKHAYFHKAVASAFERLVPTGEQVPYFIYFDVPTEEIDVNIHPTKTEIKFENEKAIWQILLAVVREAVGLYNDVPSIDFDNEGRPDIPVFDPNASTSAPKVDYNPNYNPFKEVEQSSSRREVTNWESLYEGLGNEKEEPQSLFTPDEPISESESLIAEKSPSHYQYKGKYIMTSVKSGLMIIDQHRAHLRILYENFMEQLNQRINSSQKVLFPEMVQIPAASVELFNKIIPEIERIGFEISNLGGGSYALQSVPADLQGLDMVALIHDMLDNASEQGVNSPLDDIHHALALTMARSAAIPYGQVLSNVEMDDLITSLFATTNINYTPTGKTILSILNQTDISKLFN